MGGKTVSALADKPGAGHAEDETPPPGTPTHGGGCPVARDVPCPCWGELWLCRAGALRSATAARTAGRRPRLLPRRAAERTGTGCQGRSGRDAGAAGSGAGGHSPIWAPRGRASPARSSTRAAIVPGQPKGTGAGSRRRSPSASGRGVGGGNGSGSGSAAAAGGATTAFPGAAGGRPRRGRACDLRAAPEPAVVGRRLRSYRIPIRRCLVLSQNQEWPQGIRALPLTPTLMKNHCTRGAIQNKPLLEHLL